MLPDVQPILVDGEGPHGQAIVEALIDQFRKRVHGIRGNQVQQGRSEHVDARVGQPADRRFFADGGDPLALDLDDPIGNRVEVLMDADRSRMVAGNVAVDHASHVELGHEIAVKDQQRFFGPRGQERQRPAGSQRFGFPEVLDRAAVPRHRHQNSPR